MSRIFLSHSSADNAQAIAIRDWLASEGWDDVFLDLDPKRGIAAGERWERALIEAADRCEVVLFLVSCAWLASGWCRKELSLAHRLNKRFFGVLIEDLSIEEVPKDLFGDWQLVRLASGRDHVIRRVVLPITHEEVHVTFSAEGMQRLKHGLEQAGLDPKGFAWPPANDPKRAPYRGLQPFEADDAGIFFGRDGPIVSCLDALRGHREALSPRMLVILGASGAGKSSFLRAGLLPRLKRDNRNYFPLPVIRPERAALHGDTGFLHALTKAFEDAAIRVPRAELRMAIDSGVEELILYLKRLVTATPASLENNPKPPMLVLAIDQGEELFLSEGHDEAQRFLVLLRELLTTDDPAVIALFTIRSDNYERLQLAEEIEGVRQDTFSLPPMPKGVYAEIIKGPLGRLEGTPRDLKIEDGLVDAVLADVETGSATPALPFCHARLTSSRPLSDKYPKELNALGDHIRKRRLDLDLFQKDVARQLHVDEETIWRWERNTTSPQVHHIPRIIQFLGYDPFAERDRHTTATPRRS